MTCNHTCPPCYSCLHLTKVEKGITAPEVIKPDTGNKDQAILIKNIKERLERIERLFYHQVGFKHLGDTGYKDMLTINYEQHANLLKELRADVLLLINQ